MPGAALADLDPTAAEAARRRFVDNLIRTEAEASRHVAMRVETATWDVQTLLSKARITKQGRITRTPQLLPGRD